MIKREFATEMNKVMLAMEKCDAALEEIKAAGDLTPDEYTRLYIRYQDLCDCVYRMATAGHKLERYEWVDECKKPLAMIFKD